MMFSVRALFSIAILGAVAVGGCKSSDDTAAQATTASQLDEPLTVERSVEMTLTARVKSVDLATRRLAVQDSAGQELVFYVDPEVRRLSEVRPGDTVRLGGRSTLVAELRPPTPEEAANPITIVDTETRASAGQSPAANMQTTYRVVTTVVGLDVAKMLVTLRGPLGDTLVVRGRNEANVRRLRLGDSIVITYTEAVAILVDKQQQ